MTLYAVSDLHLGLPGAARMFDDLEQGRWFGALCERVARDKDAELLLLGDVFDLTACTPPLRGLAQFAEALEFPLAPPASRTLAQTCAGIREANEVALGWLEALSMVAPVTLVPGNHDRHLEGADGRAALDAAGLSRVRLEPAAVRRAAGHVVVLQHGHAWDPGNERPQAGGEVMTAVLHHAVVPFLRHLAPRRNVRIDPDRVVALRPEERVVPVLERWLQPGLFERFLDAFLELLVENGYLPRPLSFFVTRGLIRARLKDDDDLWERAGAKALAALEGTRPIPGRPPPPDVLVLGHTHVPDWAVHEGRPGAQRLYVNLGTWTARASDAAGPLDLTLPALRIAAVDGRFTAELQDARTGGELQRFETPA